MPYRKNFLFPRGDAMSPIMDDTRGLYRTARAIIDICELLEDATMQTVPCAVLQTCEEFSEANYVVAETIYDALSLKHDDHPMVRAFRYHMYAATQQYRVMVIARPV